MHGLLWLCWFASGAAALGLELLWMRSATLVIGGSAATTATVLAWYFAGLGIGAAIGGRGSARPVRRYALLELGVALGALWSLAFFAGLATDSAQAWIGTNAARAFGVIGLATLPATLCLGATLPALGQALVAAERIGVDAAWLAAANTLGGAVGLAVVGFGMPAAIGVRASYVVVALQSAVAGATALAVGRRAGSLPPGEPRRAGAPSRAAASDRRRLRAVAAVCGALGIGLEVLWARLFAQVLHNSVYSFNAVALVFVVALALGSGIAALLARRHPARDLAAGALGLAAAATLGGYWLFLESTEGLAYVGMTSGLAAYVLRIIGLAAMTAGPAALASGAVLPALWGAWGEPRAVARPLGDLTAANTLGAVVGAVGAGFVVMPTIGLRGGMLLAVVAYVVAAHVIAPPAWRFRPALHVVVLAAVLADPARGALVNLHPSVETLRAVYEGPAAVTSVVDVRGNRQLRLDNYYVLGGSEAAGNQRRMGLVPLLLHPDPTRVLFIGLATGITASAAPALGVPETTVVELIPEVATAARAHFAEWNGGLLERGDVNLVIDDGRRHLQVNDERFDVIVSDLFVPWHAGTSSLYAREMYQTAARRLTPDGLFCQWLPLYQLTREEFDVIAHTFLSVFPHVTLWRDDFYPNRPVVALIGRATAAPIDVARAAERIAGLASTSGDAILSAPRGLAMLYAGDLTRIAGDFAAAPINADDHPVIEFRAPRLTRMGARGDKDWFVGEALADFYDRLLARDPEMTEAFEPATDALAEARRAGSAMVRYALAEARGDSATAARLQAAVRASVPEVVAGVSGDDVTAEVGGLRESLGALQSEQEVVRQRLEAMERTLGRLGVRDDP